MLVFLNLLAATGFVLLAPQMTLRVALTVTDGLLLLNGASLCYNWYRPSRKAAQSSPHLRRAMAVVGIVFLCEALAGFGVVAEMYRTRDAVDAYQQQSRQDLAATMACEREADRCWQEAARTAHTAFGMALMVTMGPKDALDLSARRAILLRTIALADAESKGEAMRGWRAIDRACARSLLCSVSLGRGAAQDAIRMGQTIGMIELLAQRTVDQ